MDAPSEQGSATGGEDAEASALLRRATDARPAEADARAATVSRLYGDALRVGAPVRALAAVDQALADGLTAAAVHAQVIAPAMHRIGDLWEQGAIGVADEHLATAIGDGTLAHLYPLLQVAEPRSRERVLVASVEGERHVLGLRTIADVLEGAGFDVLFLGGEVPPGALIEACRKHRPAVVALGVTMRANLPALLGEATALASLDEPPRIVLGGQGIPASIGQALSFPVPAGSEQILEAVERALESGARVDPPSQSAIVGAITEILPGDRRAEQTDPLAEQFAAAAAATAETARQQSRRAVSMERLAFRDPLTDLWNRRAFDDRFRELVETTGGDVAVAMVDIDCFKETNDEHGHAIGDRVLIEVADALRRSVRPEDFVARLGGDEFAVLLPVADADTLAEIGERIRATVEATSGEPATTVSVGISGFRTDRRLTTLSADQALFRAKAGGRNRVAVDGGG